jgi:hypothetical protein
MKHPMTPPTSITRRHALASAGIGLFGASLAASSLAAEPSAASSSYYLDVRAFGAKGDGATDDTAAFQTALDSAYQSGGGSVFVPPGRYLVASHLVVPQNVTLEGIFTAPPTTPWRSDTPDGKPQLAGSVLLAVEGAGKPDGTPFIQLSSNATLKGIAVFHPEQRETNPPVAYPWTISSSLHGADNCSIIDVLLVNPYQAVDFGGRATGRHLIRNLNAAPLFRGLFIDHCLDVGRVENVHFWPFWGSTGPASEFRLKEGKAFVIGRTDWQHITNCFCIAYETGFQFLRGCSTHPAYQGGGNAQILGGGADLCNRAVHVVELQGHSGVRFVNSQLYGDIIVENTNHGPVQFTACGLFGSVTGAQGVALARIEGGGKVSFTDCHIHCIDPRNTSRPLIHAKAGRMQVRGCEILDGHSARDHVVLEPDVAYAVISDNTSRAPFSVVNNAKGKTVVRDNIGEA